MSGKNVTHVTISRHSDGSIFVVTLNRGPPKKAVEGAFAEGLVVAMAGKPADNNRAEEPCDDAFHHELREAHFIPVFADATPRKSFEDNSAIQVRLYKPKPNMPDSLPMKAFVFYYDVTTGGDKSHDELMSTLTSVIVSALKRSDQIKLQNGTLRRVPAYAEWTEDNDLSEELDEEGTFQSPDHVLTNAGVVNLAVWGFVQNGDASVKVDENSTQQLVMYNRAKKVRDFFSVHEDLGYCNDACVKLGFPFSDKHKNMPITDRVNILDTAIRTNINGQIFDETEELLDSLCNELLLKINPSQLTADTWKKIDNLLTYVISIEQLNGKVLDIAQVSMKFYNAHNSETGTRAKLQKILDKISGKRGSIQSIASSKRSKKEFKRNVTLSQGEI